MEHFKVPVCNYCGASISIGWGQRRYDSKFCCDEHKDLYWRARRKLIRKLAQITALQEEVKALQGELRWDTTD